MAVAGLYKHNSGIGSKTSTPSCNWCTRNSERNAITDQSIARPAGRAVPSGRTSVGPTTQLRADGLTAASLSAEQETANHLQRASQACVHNSMMKYTVQQMLAAIAESEASQSSVTAVPHHHHRRRVCLYNMPALDTVPNDATSRQPESQCHRRAQPSADQQRS